MASCANMQTDAWIGSILINRENRDLAAQAAAAIAQKVCRYVEVWVIPVPAGGPPIPPGFYGRLLNYEEMEQLEPGVPPAHVAIDADGKIGRID